MILSNIDNVPNFQKKIFDSSDFEQCLSGMVALLSEMIPNWRHFLDSRVT